MRELLIEIPDGFSALKSRLASLDEVHVAANDKIRHPGATLVVSMGRVLDRLERVLPDIESTVGQQFSEERLPDQADLLERYEALLYSLDEYTEASVKILGAISERSSQENPCRRFMRSIKVYAERISPLVNAVKHEQGRLREVWFFSEHLILPGIYVETANGERSVGPNPHLHDGGFTALSLYRDLAFHFFGLILVTRNLENAIESISGGEVVAKATESRLEDRLMRIAHRIEVLPKWCFLDEIWKPGPRVRLRERGGSVCIRASLGVEDGCWSSPKNGRIHARWKADGASKRFQMPYLGEAWLALTRKNLRKSMLHRIR